MKLFNTQNIKSIRELSSNNSKMDKTLGPIDLLLLGVGAVIGTGIFVLTGIASQYSGPALFFSFLISAVVCMFVALVYTEVAAMIPTSGSVYTYSYVALGEIFAWISACLLILEFSVGAMTVAVGWSSYMVEILRQGGIELPVMFTTPYFGGGMINLPAVIISLFLTFILVRGTQTGALINNTLVAVKLLAIFIFLIIAAPHFSLNNWDDFTPFGVNGVIKAAAVVLLAYTGFDSLATTVEECKNPKRDITIGLIGSLVVCAILYMAVAAMLTGIVPYSELNNAKPLAYALKRNGSNIGSALVAVGGMAGMTTVILVNIYAQSRVLFVMSRDGLLPGVFSKLHTKYHTPYLSVIVVGIVVSIIAGLVPINVLSSLASMGTLSIFIIASIVVVVLRKQYPDIERPFKCPVVYLISILSIVCCGYLFLQLIPEAGIYYIIWLFIGLILYFICKLKCSRVDIKNMLESK
ncbi:amino acid permease [Rickettsiales bacterium Ac37b]|nr:amino acid permease [Rickettsiales bacterium Ac37b]